jgi:hypothetical protein
MFSATIGFIQIILSYCATREPDNTVTQGGSSTATADFTAVQDHALDLPAYHLYTLSQRENWGIYSIREKLNEEYLAAITASSKPGRSARHYPTLIPW